uniref:transcriptional regulator FtsR n=1 Tax=Gephyromycinifex aptenodytis TaxID=2716227 RepID=UPI001D028734|nr:MerR family transcriptional regulator [Gephyromycinifex aptenodytis]
MLERLRPDFPDVSISKIRFLEAEGLIKPDRTPSGYRSFNESDVERLRYILQAQRDRFWPLRVIREALDAQDRGLEVPTPESVSPRAPASLPDPDLPSEDQLTPGGPALRLTRRELSQASGLQMELLDALVTYGLLRPDREGHFSASALPVASAAADLAAFGVEPRHLRAFRTAADREIGLVEQVIAPLKGRADGAAARTRARFLRHCIALHTALVRAGLEDDRSPRR